MTSDPLAEPPRKPRGARRWMWVAVLGLVVAAYVGSYIALRADGKLLFVQVDTMTETMHERVVTPSFAFYVDMDTTTISAFRPCIAVEEWWRNR